MARRIRDYIKTHRISALLLIVIIAHAVTKIGARQVWGYRFSSWFDLIPAAALIGLVYIDWKAARSP